MEGYGDRLSNEAKNKAMKSFEILHFSYRHWGSYHEQGCYKVNLVFRVCDISGNSYTKQKFLTECEEWRKTEIVQDLDLQRKYSDGLRMINKKTGKDLFEELEEGKKEITELDFINLNSIERKDVFIKGYEENWNTMFQYIEKFDVFRFYEYFEINPATKGIIKYIEKLREIYNPDEYLADQLFRALKSLELWWD